MEISKTEYEALLDRFTSAEKRVSHLNSLLSEAETESQRMSQLAEVLKEEIRTYQRSEERSKHIENLEYVKNVIIKVHFYPSFHFNLNYYSMDFKSLGYWATKKTRINPQKSP